MTAAPLRAASRTKPEAVASLRAHGQNQLASMVGAMNVTPGHGVNLDALGRILGLAALVYLFGAAFNYGQGYLFARPEPADAIGSRLGAGPLRPV